MKIHTFNARDSLIWDIEKYAFDTSSEVLYEKIAHMFDTLKEKLLAYEVDYKRLKHALVPDKKKKEYGFVFDSNLIDDCFYGGEIIKNFKIPFEELNNSAVFFSDIVGESSVSVQDKIFESLSKNIVLFNDLNYMYSSQFSIVYINNLSKKQFNTIIEHLKNKNYFIGYIDFTFDSYIKLVVSLQIGQMFILHENKIIQSLIDGDASGVNNTGFDFSQTKKNIINIDEYLYLSFLSYKIKRSYSDYDRFDQELSINSVQPDQFNISHYKIIIEDSKFKYLFDNKFGSIRLVCGNEISKEQLVFLISQNINLNYLYNIELNDYGCLKFNTDIELINANSKQKSKILLSFEILKEKKEIRLITLY